MSKKVAVILSGCGFLDGAEIRESVLTLLHLDAAGAEVTIFAPNKKQHHVVNHLDSNEAGEERNILEEAARIARCKVSPLTELNANDFEALFIPGGFGVAKNLCSFAFDGSGASIDETVQKVINDFYTSQKAIGALCIAPALLALCLGDKGIKVTIGNDEGTAKEIEKIGAKHIECKASDCVVDTDHRIVTTPAYMYDSEKLHHINQGIEKCVRKTLEF